MFALVLSIGAAVNLLLGALPYPMRLFVTIVVEVFLMTYVLPNLLGVLKEADYWARRQRALPEPARIEDSRKSQALRVRIRGAQVSPTSWRLAGMSLKVDGWGGDLASESLVPHGFPQVQEFLEAIKLQVELNR